MHNKKLPKRAHEEPSRSGSRGLRAKVVGRRISTITMSIQETIPLLNHPLGLESAFTPESLVDAVRAEKGLPVIPIPEVCVLDFDGDLTDWLVRTGAASPCPSWACFHTSMFSVKVDTGSCGVIARTIGGPYAVLIAEQLAVSGARVVIGLTSAGRVNPSLPIPSLVVATQAIRDEGTSYHYLPPGETVDAPPRIADVLAAGAGFTRDPGLPRGGLDDRCSVSGDS